MCILCNMRVYRGCGEVGGVGKGGCHDVLYAIGRWGKQTHAPSTEDRIKSVGVTLMMFAMYLVNRLRVREACSFRPIYGLLYPRPNRRVQDSIQQL